MARPPSLQQQLFLRAAYLFPRSSCLSEAQQLWQCSDWGAHGLPILSSSLEAVALGEEVPTQCPGTKHQCTALRKGWLPSCIKSPVPVPGGAAEVKPGC